MVVLIFLAAVMSVIEHFVTDIVEDGVSALASCRDYCTHYCFFLIVIPLLPLSHPTNPSPLPFLSWQHWLCACVRARACVCVLHHGSSLYVHHYNHFSVFCLSAFSEFGTCWFILFENFSNHYLLDLEEVSSMIEQYCWID
jgi:hypothetical protein